MGKAGRTMEGEHVGLPGRITGLDPAGPRFWDGPIQTADPDLVPERLRPGSATFVDIIHTNGAYKPAAARVPPALGAIYQLGDRCDHSALLCLSTLQLH